jgi:putative redox protein
MAEVTVSSLGNLRQEIRAGRHMLVADEPREVGGEDAGPLPYELLLGALGACTSMTLQLYSRRKSWPLERVQVRLRHQRIHAADCPDA